MTRIRLLHTLLLTLVGAFALPCHSSAEVWNYKEELLPYLIEAVPAILADQETTSGHFGEGPWIVQDQHPMYTLAAVWGLEHKANPYFQSPEVLEAVMKAGDALIEEQDKRGQWMFRKKDGSTWGKIFMPWTYSRWVRAYGLIRDAMPAERRVRWEKALRLGYEGIAEEELDHIHNIPVHHAMGLYHAGELFGRDDWKSTAAAFLVKAAATQHPDGYWSENVGPVVGYNTVYVDAFGVYYGMSRDPAVLPALERAARFHANFTYPDGSNVETVDERQVYHAGTSMPVIGFIHSPLGRGYMQRQWEQKKRSGAKSPISAELVASLLLYGTEGELTPLPALTKEHRYVQGDGKAMVQRRGPWFICLSGYTCPVPQSRWMQDRQNLVSLFHDKTGVILGGGNTKLQPLWSTFTAGDVSLLRHKAGEEEPDFTPPSGLLHVPGAGRLEPDQTALILEYGAARCRVQADLSATTVAMLLYRLESATTMPVEAHLPFLPSIGKEWRTESGTTGTLGSTSWTLGPGEAGGWFEHAGWRVDVPPDATVTWPALPHNQYRKDGRAEPKEGKIVLTLPLGREPREQAVSIQIAD